MLPAKHRMPGLMPLRTPEPTIAGVLMLPEATCQVLRGRLALLMQRTDTKKVEIGSVTTFVGQGLRAPALTRAQEQVASVLGTRERAAT